VLFLKNTEVVTVEPIKVPKSARTNGTRGWEWL